MKLPSILPGGKARRARRAARAIKLEETMRRRRAFQREAAGARDEVEQWGSLMHEANARARQIVNASTAKMDGLERRASMRRMLAGAGHRVLNAKIFADAKTPAAVAEIKAEAYRARGRASLALERRAIAREKLVTEHLIAAEAKRGAKAEEKRDRAWQGFAASADARAARERMIFKQAASAQAQLRLPAVRATADATSIRLESMQVISLT